MFGDRNYIKTIKPPMNECKTYHFKRNILGTIIVALLLAANFGLQHRPHAMKNLVFSSVDSELYKMTSSKSPFEFASEIFLLLVFGAEYSWIRKLTSP